MERQQLSGKEKAERLSVAATWIHKEAQRIGVDCTEFFNVVDSVKLRYEVREELTGSFTGWFRFEDNGIWGGDCRVGVRLSEVDGRVAGECEVSWSSTGRSVSNATAAVEIYRRAISFAAYVEAALNR